MKLNEKAFALACAAAFGIVWLVCSMVVMMLPDKPQVLLDTGEVVNTSLVVKEGQNIALNCAAAGTNIRLVWWEQEDIIDSTYR